MKPKMLFFVIALFAAVLSSCSDDEKQVKGDPDLTHEGVQWTIQSSDYTLIDQNTSGGIGQTFKTGTSATGTFYFVDGGEKGSFEMSVEGYNKEDAFGYTIDGENVSIFAIDQQVGGVQTNQNVIALTGSSTDTEMTISGAITKQTTTGQFVLEIELTLKKK
jgi:hypothetical protein